MLKQRKRRQVIGLPIDRDPPRPPCARFTLSRAPKRGLSSLATPSRPVLLRTFISKSRRRCMSGSGSRPFPSKARPPPLASPTDVSKPDPSHASPNAPQTAGISHQGEILAPPLCSSEMVGPLAGIKVRPNVIFSLPCFSLTFLQVFETGGYVVRLNRGAYMTLTGCVFLAWNVLTVPAKIVGSLSILSTLELISPISPGRLGRGLSST